MSPNSIRMSCSFRVTVQTLVTTILCSSFLGFLVWSSEVEHSHNLRLQRRMGAPLLSARPDLPCFQIGDQALPDEFHASIVRLSESITCDFSRTTIGGVPDVSTATRSFSEINFASSSTSPLRFALENLATKTPSTSTLRIFEDRLDLYLATEAGLRSEGVSSEIVMVRKFLELQVARIKSARGIEIQDPEKSPEYLLGEVLRSAGDDEALLGDIMALDSRVEL